MRSNLESEDLNSAIAKTMNTNKSQENKFYFTSTSKTGVVAEQRLPQFLEGPMLSQD